MSKIYMQSEVDGEQICEVLKDQSYLHSCHCDHCTAIRHALSLFVPTEVPQTDVDLVEAFEKLLNMDQAVYPPQESCDKAAALLAAYAKRLPRAMPETKPWPFKCSEQNMTKDECHAYNNGDCMNGVQCPKSTAIR